MIEKCEIYIQDTIRGKKRGPFSFFLKIFLRIMSWGFRFGIFLRNWMFDRGLRRKYYPPVPVVISIGNIVAGGTGKTPVAHLIAKHFSDIPTAILSRGYRSAAEKLPEPIMLSKGEGPLYPASFCGDEPFLLSQTLPNVLLFVGRDRQKAALMAAKAGAQMILLDDGMQHRHLARDFDVAVINAHDPFGKGFYLPRGFLRDSVKSLSRAHLVILNHVRDKDHFQRIQKKISRYTKAPCIGTTLVASDYRDLDGKHYETVSGKKAGIFCGLGYPEQFKKFVEQQGVAITGEYYTPDHIAPSMESLAAFAEKCARKGADCLICTEKDRVKIVGPWKGPLPILWIKTSLSLVEGQDHWEGFIDSIKEKFSLS